MGRSRITARFWTVFGFKSFVLDHYWATTLTPNLLFTSEFPGRVSLGGMWCFVKRFGKGRA
jgi:hypothetical protein